MKELFPETKEKPLLSVLHGLARHTYIKEYVNESIRKNTINKSSVNRIIRISNLKIVK